MLLLALLESPTEKEVFLQFYHKNKDFLYRYARSILKDERRAEEAVQEAFTRALTQPEKFFSISGMKRLPWLVMITKRICIDILRSEKRYCALPEEDQRPAAGSVPEEAAYVSLVAVIRSLPAQYREILELKLVLEWTEADIAKHLGLTRTTVSARVRRGRAILQEKLREEGYER